VGIDPPEPFSMPEALSVALEEAVKARSLIAASQEPLRELAEAAANPVERRAREYQVELVEWQLTRAADIAEKRLRYLPQIKTERQAKEENELCEKDAAHWFAMYAWAVDPRPDAPLNVMPFELFPFQERYVRWLDKITFEHRVSGLTEKCRDMGATETFLRWMWRNWRYRSSFIGMTLSANEDLVDSKKDPSTLFEKLRFQTRMVPAWMLPKGFSPGSDMPFMLIENPENRSVIIGDAPTANVGRQRRATVILGDEYATWPFGGYPQYAALSRTTNTFCPVSSVFGKNNKFADIAHDGNTPKFEMDWRDHPWRDQRWFDALPFGYVGAAMTTEEIAQEVERNYDASQPGRVLKNIQEPYVLITWDEMVAGFERLGASRLEFYNGHTPIVPYRWNWGRVTDYGESARDENDTHIWAYTLFSRPGEGQPLNDSLFFFHALPIEPIGATEMQGYAYYAQLERQLGLRDSAGFTRKPQVNDMSHEATDPKEVLLRQCGDHWATPDLDFDRGRRKLVFHFEVIDKHLENPFRPDLMGRCRIYFVALPRQDNRPEFFMAKNERQGEYFITQSQSQRGFKRLRAEWNSWHYPPEERGKPVPRMRPKAVFDDIITCVRYAVARWGVDPQPMTDKQRRERALPEELQDIARIERELGTQTAERAIVARMRQFAEMDEKAKAQRSKLSRYRPARPNYRVGVTR
jgi:hypothetical protein